MPDYDGTMNYSTPYPGTYPGYTTPGPMAESYPCDFGCGGYPMHYGYGLYPFGPGYGPYPFNYGFGGFPYRSEDEDTAYRRRPFGYWGHPFGFGGFPFGFGFGFGGPFGAFPFFFI